ncbi:MAG: nucleotide exchange factor GrpE [Leptospirales bacterium]|nr:nucleotide exchange factor GrpE [Leptospirales bacterium]
MAESEQSSDQNVPPGVEVAAGDGFPEQRQQGQQGDAEQASGADAGLLSRLAAAEQEIQELKENWQRERADFSNFRKRTMQERARVRAEASAAFAQDLFEPMDNLERTLAAPAESDETRSFKTGVEMIRVSLLQAFDRQKIRMLRPEGQAFDPFTMEAIASQDSEEVSVDTVVEVYQPGYQIEQENGERQTLRPARVRVARARNAATNSAGETAN